jgi:hypothetical protein
MQETRMVKAIHSWKPISRRPIGRPKIRWEDDIRKDIQKLKVPNWKILVQDRRRWKELVEKAKSLHKELYSHNNNKKKKKKLGCHPVAVVILHVHKYEISN